MQDKNTYTVSPKWNTFILGLAFLRPFFSTDSIIVPITGLLLGGGVCLLVYVLCHGKGFGGGDVKLAAVGGAMLGGDILYALLVACVCSVIAQIGLVDNVLKKFFSCGNSTRSFAFVPYMSLGMEVVLLIHILIES